MPSSSASDPEEKKSPEELAEAGLDVVGIEAELVGGECPYWGCIPSKMMVRAADLLAEGAASAAWRARRRSRRTGGRSPDGSATSHRQLGRRVAVERFEGKGGRFIRGRARVVGPIEVEVGGETRDGPAGARAGHRPAALVPAALRGGAALDEPRRPSPPTSVPARSW